MMFLELLFVHPAYVNLAPSPIQAFRDISIKKISLSPWSIYYRGEGEREEGGEGAKRELTNTKYVREIAAIKKNKMG